MGTPTPVTVGTFVRAESDRMLRDLQQQAGGVNVFGHHRRPTDIADQPVIRMNRDTLYSFAVVDLAEGAELTLPDAGARYISAMVVNQDHLINEVHHTPGSHPITQERTGSRYALVAVRILVDPDDQADVATVHTLQDGIGITAGSAQPFEMADYDTASLDEIRVALLTLMKHMPSTAGAFGSHAEVDPVRHLIGTAAGWGGLPTSEAVYVNIASGLPVGRYTVRVPEVPVDGFWSLSVYNGRGFFEPNALQSYSVNSVTAVRDDDGAVTVHLGDWGPDVPNVIPLPDGWNCIARLYRPRPEVVDGSWTFPAPS